MQFHRPRARIVTPKKIATVELRQFFYACQLGQLPPKGVKFCEFRQYYGLHEWIFNLWKERGGNAVIAGFNSEFVTLDVADLDRLQNANTDGLLVNGTEQTYNFSFANRRARINECINLARYNIHNGYTIIYANHHKTRQNEPAR